MFHCLNTYIYMRAAGVLRPLDDVLNVMEDRFEEAEAALDGIEQQAAEGKCEKAVR